MTTVSERIEELKKEMLEDKKWREDGEYIPIRGWAKRISFLLALVDRYREGLEEICEPMEKYHNGKTKLYKNANPKAGNIARETLAFNPEEPNDSK